MTVAEAIAQLQQEDPNAQVVVLTRGQRFTTLREVRYREQPYYRLHSVAGKDSTTDIQPSACVLIIEHFEG